MFLVLYNNNQTYHNLHLESSFLQHWLNQDSFLCLNVINSYTYSIKLSATAF